ncbi:MAG TPA: hypothetical protein VNC40_12945 [Gaiellaceae bacterium]|nr:hypothetical protein [Gaiellaceae bacterium]
MRLPVALGVVATVTLVTVLVQPFRAPWWINADADAAYTASGIELAAGEHTFYLDHPGMPLEDLMAITVESRRVLHNLNGGNASPHQYAAQRLVNLDDSRPYFRGWAIAFFSFGAFVTFFALSALFVNPLWGAAGALLWLTAPDLANMSIQFRPDGLLAGLVVACGALIVRAAERRSAWTYALAALLLGLTITVKIHAAGLFLPFAIALAWRPPGPGWRTSFVAGARRWLRRYRIALGVFAAVWIAFAVAFNSERAPIILTHEERVAVLELAAAFGDYLLVVGLFAWLKLRRRGPFSPFGAVLASALAVGILLPGTLFLNDLPEMLNKIVGGLTGSGVNNGIRPFTTPLSELLHYPFDSTLALVSIAAVAAALGVIRRDPFPVLWFTGSLVTGVMALARLGTLHYFEPAYVLSIPAVLWLLRTLRPPAVGALATAALLAVVLNPFFAHLHAPAQNAASQEIRSRVFARLAHQLLKPGEIALSDSYAEPTPDTRWFGLVHQFIAWTPAYPYRFMPADAGPATAEGAGLRPAYFIGELPLQLRREQQVTLGFGTYDLRPIPALADPGDGIGVALLVHGPGVDSPLGG